MKKAINIFTAGAIIVLLSSFSGTNTNNFIGTFGVSASDPSQIKLTIHADHTFYYQDFSVSNKQVIITGKWEQKGEKVMLKSNEPGKKFHDTWTFANNGKVAKSRKGLAFYRLGKIDG